jgi:hypothetical protein
MFPPPGLFVFREFGKRAKEAIGDDVSDLAEVGQAKVRRGL